MDIRKLRDLHQAAADTGIPVEVLDAWVKAQYCPHYWVNAILEEGKVLEKGPLFQISELRDWIDRTQLRRVEGRPIPMVARVIVRPAAPYNSEIPFAIRGIEGLCAYRLEGNCSGIYFLCEGPDVVYVGQSMNILTRLSVHMANPDLDGRFNAIFYLPAPGPELNRLEAEFINLLKPKLNKAIPRLRNGD